MVLHFDFMGISSGAIPIDDAFEKLYARFTQAAGRKVGVGDQLGKGGQWTRSAILLVPDSTHQTVFV
jgi:hypothetical protein